MGKGLQLGRGIMNFGRLVIFYLLSWLVFYTISIFIIVILNIHMCFVHYSIYMRYLNIKKRRKIRI